MDAERLVQELIKETGADIEYREVDISVDAAARVRYGIQAVPSVAVLDGSGAVVRFFTGVPGRAPLEEALRDVSS